ncbi:MAG: hypothetical protein K6A71_00325 [Lachnospiraceae bacterium]|nr:hypothetical protein [Lachnospiraceae bacterium]
MNKNILTNDQVKQINRLLLIVLAITTFFGIVGLMSQLTDTSNTVNPIQSIVPAILLVINFIATIIVSKAKEPEFLHKFVAVAYTIVYASMLLTSESGAVFPYLIPIMIIIVLNLDRKTITGMGVAFIILNIVHAVITMATHEVTEVIEMVMVSIIISILATLASIMGTRLLTRFISDNMEGIEKAALERARVSENILRVTDEVTSSFDTLKSGLDEVGETSRLVCDSIDQIGQGNDENLSAVELQTTMTGEIQTLLNETGEITEEAVEVSAQMSEMLGKSLKDMESLVNQAIKTTEVGNQMQEAAERQQKSSDEAMNITDMIFSISGQTNLLALNASIEAARAGEAGRGFAVVATEISHLAEQTKQSTEQITNILKELTENAGEVSEKATQTVQMAGAQKDLVEVVKGMLTESRDYSDKLGETLRTVNSDMDRIKDSNDEVVNSTSRLLATSEEFTASTQETIRISRNNMDKIEESIDIMAKISDKMQELARAEEK